MFVSNSEEKTEQLLELREELETNKQTLSKLRAEVSLERCSPPPITMRLILVLSIVPLTTLSYTYTYNFT